MNIKIGREDLTGILVVTHMKRGLEAPIVIKEILN